MDSESQLGMICGYFLSRLDGRGYNNLGFGNQRETHARIGELLGVKPASVKNWRDEFDPIHDNGRRGWADREMLPSRVRVVETFKDVTDSELTEIVGVILANPSGYIARHVLSLLDDGLRRVGAEEGGEEEPGWRPTRAQTGQRAEQLFEAYHECTGLPACGALRDTRLEGCGYDYSIEMGEASGPLAVEVKGWSGTGGKLWPEFHEP